MTANSEHALNGQVRRFAILWLIVSACFAMPLWDLLHFSSKSNFFSYIPLVPFISGYLVWIQRDKLPTASKQSWPGALAAAVGGAALLGLGLWVRRAEPSLDISTYLAIITASYLCFVLAVAFYAMGAEFLAAIAFPVAFLAFLIPLPSFLLDPTVVFFQHASAWTAVAMIKTAGTPVILNDLDLYVPGMPLRVAPECSGIQSTMVLLMTSLLAGHMFLQSNGRRAVLVLIVVPLAILRNGFRIFVIGELCVHVGPFMIDSWIHHHGGPVFFALSLIPMFALLVLLRKADFSRSAIPPAASPVSNPL